MGKIKGPRNQKLKAPRKVDTKQQTLGYTPNAKTTWAPKREIFFPGFSANSSNPESKPLTPAAKVEAPTLLFTDDAWLTIKHIVASQSVEVGWFGLVRKINDRVFEVYEIFVPKQTVTGATVDIDEDAMAQLFNQLIIDNKPAECLVYHGHSHVNMAINPSGTDETMFEEYAFRAHERFFRSIHNKQGDSRVDCVDKTTGYIHTRINHGMRQKTLTKEQVALVDATLTENVQRRTYNVPQKLVSGTLSAADINQRYMERMRIQNEWRNSFGLEDEI